MGLIRYSFLLKMLSYKTYFIFDIMMEQAQK